MSEQQNTRKRKRTSRKSSKSAKRARPEIAATPVRNFEIHAFMRIAAEDDTFELLTRNGADFYFADKGLPEEEEHYSDHFAACAKILRSVTHRTCSVSDCRFDNPPEVASSGFAELPLQAPRELTPGVEKTPLACEGGIELLRLDVKPTKTSNAFVSVALMANCQIYFGSPSTDEILKEAENELKRGATVNVRAYWSNLHDKPHYQRQYVVPLVDLCVALIDTKGSQTLAEERAVLRAQFAQLRLQFPALALPVRTVSGSMPENENHALLKELLGLAKELAHQKF